MGASQVSNSEANTSVTSAQKIHKHGSAAAAQTELEERKIWTKNKIVKGFWMRGDFAVFITRYRKSGEYFMELYKFD